MRPGREAPENFQTVLDSLDRAAASMRPGREAPENQDQERGPSARHRRFNEAGARGPGKRGSAMRGSCRRDGFNEAGARGPGKHDADADAEGLQVASMRPGREAPENNADATITTSKLLLQ